MAAELSPDNGGSGEEMDEKSFPGLNKSHGFFSLIERNQKARDSYHQEQEEVRPVIPLLQLEHALGGYLQARRLQVQKQARKLETQKRKKSSGQDQGSKPALSLYCPPQRRVHRDRNTHLDSGKKKFLLEVEISPNQWWSGVIQVMPSCVHALTFDLVIISVVRRKLFLNNW